MGIMFTSEACGGVINVCPTIGNAQREGATDAFNITLFEVFTGENKHCATQVTWCFHLLQVFSFIVPTRLQRATQRVLHRLFHTRYHAFFSFNTLFLACFWSSYWHPQSHARLLLDALLSVRGYHGFLLKFSMLFFLLSWEDVNP